METGLRYQSRITGNFLSLMTLDGAIPAVGLVSEPVPQSLAFVAASIITPGFEPLAKVPLGMILTNRQTAWMGFRSSLVGYALVAAITFLI